jgi:two-component system, cell cycle sensor histidine kinase and response regulator CckA
VLVSNTDRRFIRANTAFCRMLGYTEEELKRLSFEDVTHPDHRAGDLEGVTRLWKGEIRQYRTEKRYLKKNGETLWGALIVTLIRSEAGKPLYFLSMIENIAERKRAEEEQARLRAQFIQAQKMESVGRLAGGVAHDFNNLIMGIMGYAQLCLDETRPDNPIREWLAEIMHGAERSAKLTRQLLAFARKQTIAPKVLDLNETIAKMFKLLRPLIGENIAITFRPGSGTWSVKMDQSQIDQILANLVVNSGDAISGTGAITIETGNATIDESFCSDHPDYSPGDYVILTVSDTGSGMTQEALDHLFEPFFTTKGAGKGTGLGLATVYGIVRQNDGFIQVDSEPGKGTSFRIYLRRCLEQCLPQTAPAPRTVPLRGSETILLVEDEKSVRITAHMSLQGLGYAVLAADTPMKALRLAEQHPGEIHLLMTDVVMPDMSGRDLADRLLKLRPGIKLLFISGFTADIIAQEGILDEGTNFLAKPFGRDELARKVRGVLDGIA